MIDLHDDVPPSSRIIKFVAIPSQAIPLALLSVFGFREPVLGVPQQQGPLTLKFIKFVFFVLPCLFSLLSFVIKMRFPLRTTQQMLRVREGIALHMRGEAGVDPLTNKVLTD